MDGGVEEQNLPPSMLYWPPHDGSLPTGQNQPGYKRGHGFLCAKPACGLRQSFGLDQSIEQRVLSHGGTECALAKQ